MCRNRRTAGLDDDDADVAVLEEMLQRGAMVTNLIVVSDDSSPAAEHEVDSVESKRRASVRECKMFARLLVNGFVVDSTEASTLEWPKFRLSLRQTLSMEVVRMPKSMELEIWEAGMFGSSLVTSITIPVPGSQSNDRSTSATIAPSEAVYAFAAEYPIGTTEYYKSTENGDTGVGTKVPSDAGLRFTSGYARVATQWNLSKAMTLTGGEGAKDAADDVEGAGENDALKGANVVPKSASSIIAAAEKDELLGDSVREMVAEASKFGSGGGEIGAEESDLCTSCAVSSCVRETMCARAFRLTLIESIQTTRTFAIP